MQTASIARQLDAGAVVLLSNLGFSAAGEVLNCDIYQAGVLYLPSSLDGNSTLDEERRTAQDPIKIDLSRYSSRDGVISNHAAGPRTGLSAAVQPGPPVIAEGT